MTQTSDYYEGNGKLGPRNLPDTPPVACLLEGYRRLPDSMSGDEFVKLYWHVDPRDDTKSQWIWPNDKIESFVALPDGKPAMTKITLGPGVLIDRFGLDDTGYFAPFGTPYAARSLPPSSLNQPYTVFRVLKPLQVEAGPIEPGFCQPGYGTQYIAGSGNQVIPNLLKKGVLIKIGTEETKKLYSL